MAEILYNYLASSGVCANVREEDLDEEDIYIGNDIEKDFKNCHLVPVSRLIAEIRAVKIEDNSYLLWDYSYFKVFFTYVNSYFIQNSNKKNYSNYIKHLTYELASRFYLHRNELYISHAFMGQSKKFLDNIATSFSLQEEERRQCFYKFCKIFIYFHEKCHLLERWKNDIYLNMEYRALSFIDFLEESIIKKPDALKSVSWNDEGERNEESEQKNKSDLLDNLNRIKSNKNQLREIVCDYYSIVETMKFFHKKSSYNDLYFFAMSFYSIEMAIVGLRSVSLGKNINDTFREISMRNNIRGFMLAKHANILGEKIIAPANENSLFWRNATDAISDIYTLVNHSEFLQIGQDFNERLEVAEKEKFRNMLLSEFGFSRRI